MCATPDVVMRSFGRTLEKSIATERQIKDAFAKAGYGPKKIDKWWNYYRNLKLIMPVSKDGLVILDEDGMPYYSSDFWINPLVLS